MSLIEKIDAEIKKQYDSSKNFQELISSAGIIRGLEIAKEIVISEQKEPCEYTMHDDDSKTYECSKCGALWTLNAGTPKENNMRFCPECGRSIQPATDTE